MNKVKRYKMGSCGIVLSMSVGLDDKRKFIINSWDLKSENIAKKKLIDKMKTLKDDLELKIIDLENNSIEYGD